MPSRTIFDDVTYDTWVSVYLDTHYVTESPDHELMLLGTAPCMGKWSMRESMLRAQELEDDSGILSVQAWLPIGACVEFKWAVVDVIKNKIVRWCEGRNKVITVPSVGEVRYFVPWDGVPVMTDMKLESNIQGKPFCPSDLNIPHPPTLLERIGIDDDLQYDLSCYCHYFVYFLFLLTCLFLLYGVIGHYVDLWLNPKDGGYSAATPQDPDPGSSWW